MSDPLEKEELQAALARAAKGDEVAWRRVIDAFSPRVFALIRAQCGRSDIAEEITQSTFCTVVTKIDAYAEQGRFESWIFRIAMNRLRDEMRRRKRHARPVEQQALLGLAGPADEPAAPPTVELGAMRDAIARLSEEDREVIQLRHFGELSFKQIADLLDSPLGTVLARHHRALKKIRGLMEAGGASSEHTEQ